MSGVFLTVVNMSISAGYMILAVLLLRPLIKKAPRWISVLLWGMVGLRLICPFTVESILSLIPSAETVSLGIMTSPYPGISTGVPFINSAVSPAITDTFAPAPEVSVNPLQILVPMLSIMWLAGCAIMLCYAAVSYLRLRRRVSAAVPVGENIYLCDTVSSPFVMGIFRPRIYMPFGIGAADAAHVVAHERAHISRLDHIWKPLGFLILSLHWFDPLAWLAYILLCRDIELACDEKVIRQFDHRQRADYSEALLRCSTGKSRITACPPAFGEIGIKERVKKVLRYRRPAIWITVVAVICCFAMVGCFLTDPKKGSSTNTPTDNEPQAWGAGFQLKEIGSDRDDVGIAVSYLGFTDTMGIALKLSWSNRSDKTLYYGEPFDLLYYNDGTWVPMETREGMSWTALAYPVFPDSTPISSNIQTQNEHTYSVTGYYDVTERGKYRLVTDYYFEGDGTETYSVWIDFEICGYPAE